MSLINDNLNTLATLGSAFTVYFFLKHAVKKDVKEIEKRLDRIDDKLQVLDSRISRIDGHLTGMYYHWEPRVVEKIEEKK